MALQARSSSGLLAATELVLPPPYTAVRLRESGDAFAEAKARAPRDGAGTLVYVGRFDLAEFALVLEPEEPLVQARRAFYAGMAALGDALAATAGPETAVNIGWPDAVYVNSGLVGGGRLAWPQGAREDQVPDWLVFGAMVRTASMSGDEPGASPDVTALSEEGFGESMNNQLVESFARNFMTAVDAWQESGFGAVAMNYFGYCEREQGVRRDIDDNGDLLIRRMASHDAERQELLPRLAQPAWYDPQGRGPWA